MSRLDRSFTTAGMAVALLVVAGCAAAGPSAPAPTPSAPGSPASVAPSPSPSPRPTPSASPSPVSVSTEQDGVRTTLTLDRDPMPAGEPTMITATVENIGTDPLTWFHGGCRIVAAVSGDIPGSGWRPGVVQEGSAQTYKKAILRRGLGAAPGGTQRIVFLPAALARYRPTVCTDQLIQETLKPGDSWTQQLFWGGDVESFMGPPDDGQVVLQGVFDDFLRKGDQGSWPDDARSLTVTLPTSIVGGRTSDLLDPPEIIDAALADPAFGSYVDDHDVDGAAEPVFRFDDSDGLWHVGLLLPEPYRVHVVLVDPRSGAVTRTVDETWAPSDGPP